MAKRNFRFSPPDRITGELFDRGRDVNGNPTAHYILFWDNGVKGHDWQGGSHKTRQRVQVGYSDKITSGALGIAANLFPGTRWTVEPDSVREDRHAGAVFELVRDLDAEPVPVLFRQERAARGDWRPVAVFPTLPAGMDGASATVFSHVGQHGAGSHEWYRETKPATAEQAARLRAELESAPYAYRLDPVKRWTETHDARRFGELQAQQDRARAAAAEKGGAG